MSTSLPERIAGIRADVLRRFIMLLRERYEKIERANYFLEVEQGITRRGEMTERQLDFLRRVVSLLSRPGLTDREQLAHLAWAEVALRRATQEPYALAVTIEFEKLANLRGRYADEVLPLGSDPRLAAAPALERVDALFHEVSAVRNEAGRGTDWDEEIVALVSLFERTRGLHESLARHLALARQIREERRNRLFAWAGIALALLGMAMSFALGG